MRPQFFFALLPLTLAPVAAQSVTGTIIGTVIDPSGAAVARAAVTLTQPAMGLERKATTAENGAFAFPALAPGEYRISVKLEGFKQFERRNLNLTASETLSTGEMQLQVAT